MQFATSVIRGIASMRHNTVPAPYVDTYRFPPPISFGPHDPNRALAVVEFVASHADLFDEAAERYADQTSRNLLAQLYAFMALGPAHVRLPTNTDAYWAQYDAALAHRCGPSGTTFGGNDLDVFTLDYCGERIEVACRMGHVAFTFLRRQYVFERDGVTIRPEPGEIVIDAGACLGDTALAFAACVGPSGRVISFDPMPSHVRLVEANMARNPHLRDRIDLIALALADISGNTLRFDDIGAASRPSQTGSVLVQTVALDDVVRHHPLPRVDFIKMDIEGGETAALEGAADTIRRFRPKLAISGYHKADDLIVLPRLIHAIEPRYRIYLDHYTIHQEETVIFATAAETHAG